MSEKDVLYDEAVAFVREKGRVSVTMLQKQFKVGYNRSTRIVEMMEAEGVVSPISPDGSRTIIADVDPVVGKDECTDQAGDISPEGGDGIEFDTRELSGILVARMVEEFKAMPDVWQKLSELRQDEVLNRCRNFAEEYVQRALAVFASDDRPTLYAILDKVVVKDGIQATITMPKNSEDRHKLIDSQGKDILVVVLDGNAYTGGTGKVKAEKDQKSLIEE